MLMNLSTQLESIFSSSNFCQDEEGAAANSSGMKSPRRNRTPAREETAGASAFPISSDDEQNATTAGAQDSEDPIAGSIVIDEKEKIISQVKTVVEQMQSQYNDMVKQQYDKQIQEIERNMQVMDSEKQATLKKTTDSKQQQQIELMHKQKLDDEQKKVQALKEKLK